MRKKSFSLIIFTIISIFFVLSNVTADERITSFHSNITVHKDSSMTVTETIKVRSAGIQINHGIYRDFPTRYKGIFGIKYVVGFDVIEVLKDGISEEYHFKDLSNGKRVYIGKKNVLLFAGEYTYTLTYKTNRQLGFFDDHDELYWNVTGNGWVFPIDEAKATVEIPAEIPKNNISVAGYTGPTGSKSKNFDTSTDSSGNITFTTTKPLNSYEGLTIVVSWQKGFVAEPTTNMKIQYFIKDNISLIIGVIGIIILLIYYIFVWFVAGKDPAKGTIIPLYNPPRNMSPAVIRYIMKMGYDNKIFTSSVINMAVKGFLSIQEKDDVYTITKNTSDESILTPEEKKIVKHLLGLNMQIQLIPTNHGKIKKSIDTLKNFLKLSFEKVYFLTNKQYLIPGVILSIIIVITTGLFGITDRGNFFSDIFLFAFGCAWLTIWNIGVVALLLQIIKSLKEIIYNRNKLPFLIKAVFLSIFSVPFIWADVFVLRMFSSIISEFMIGIFGVVIFINIIFYHLLKAPTLLGRKILDEIEGFKMFLTTTEKDRINFFSILGGKTIKLFEKYLPYAIALDVERYWTEQFSDILAKVTETGTHYTPIWYSGTGLDRFNAGDFASSIGGSLSNAISSSSTPPGSTSGSGGGGGGSSGGGGGGGGGGGW